MKSDDQHANKHKNLQINWVTNINMLMHGIWQSGTQRKKRRTVYKFTTVKWWFQWIIVAENVWAVYARALFHADAMLMLVLLDAVFLSCKFKLFLRCALLFPCTHTHALSLNPRHTFNEHHKFRFFFHFFFVKLLSQAIRMVLMMAKVVWCRFIYSMRLRRF